MQQNKHLDLTGCYDTVVKYLLKSKKAKHYISVMNISIEALLFRPVVPGGAMTPPNFGRSVNPISTYGGRLCPPNDTGTSEFPDLPTALPCKYLVKTLKLRAPTLSLVCDLRRTIFQKISLFVLFNDLMCKTWCHSIVDISKFDGM